MALLYMEGFDSGVVEATRWSIAIGTTTAQKRTGDSSFSVSTSASYLPITPSAMVVVGFGLLVTAWTSSTNQVHPTFLADNNAASHMNLGFDASGHLVARRSTTVVATSTQVFPINEWHYVEVKCTISDTTGIFIVRVDGVEWINFTGDTKNAGTSTNIDTLAFQKLSGVNVYVDDLYVLDGTGTTNNNFLGDVKVETLYPNGNGATNQWLGTDGNSVDNYALVDEAPANTTDYVSSATIGQRDLYEFTDLATVAGTVYGVQAMFYAQKSDVGTANIIGLARDSAGTVDSSTAKALPTTWTYVAGKLRETKPAGGAWTIADVNSTQFGVEVA